MVEERYAEHGKVDVQATTQQRDSTSFEPDGPEEESKGTAACERGTAEFRADKSNANEADERKGV